MNRIDEIVEEVNFKVRNEVRVYYSKKSLVKFAEERIKKDTGINVKVILDTWEVEHYGYYNLIIDDYDLLEDKERELIENHYYDMEDSQQEFTFILINKIFDRCASGGQAEEFLGHDVEYEGYPMPVTFTKDSYKEFKKLLMGG